MAVMRAGRVVQAGTLDEVWRRPVDGEVAAFLGYATVLKGPAAARVLEAGGTSAGAGTGEVALRRSALRVRADGPLHGRVLEARVTPDVLRLVVDVEGVGAVNAVAEQDSPVRVADDVHLQADLGRVAVLPSVPGARTS
jgi:thiamine transport system ATP-binding protein